MTRIIAPSILAADYGTFEAETKAITAAGADWIHVDIMDGSFVPPISFGAGVTKAINAATDIPLDVHLMVVEPKHLIEEFADAGADIITIHHEATNVQRETIEATLLGIQSNRSSNSHFVIGISL